jgi:hypothetical protein
VSCRVVSCRVVSCRVVSCRVVSCVLCVVVSRRVLSCLVLSCLGLSSERISRTWTLSFYASSCHTPPLQVILSVKDSTHPVADNDATTPGSSSVDVVSGERGGQMACIHDVFDRVAEKLAEAGIVVQRRDLEGFCQVLQVSDSLDQFDSTYKGRYFEAVEEIEARVAESDEDEGALKAKYKQLENKLISFDDGDDDENVEHQGARDGLWGSMVQLVESGKRALLQKELTRVQRRLAWPLFWRDILLKRGVDVEATVIRHLCAVLKIGKMGTSPKSRILRVKGRPTNQDFHAYCLHLKGAFFFIKRCSGSEHLGRAPGRDEKRQRGKCRGYIL